MPKTILVVDDHQVVRLGLQALLSVEPDFEVVGQAATADEAVAEAGRLQPQVVLMDLRLPDRSGAEACQGENTFCGVPSPPGAQDVGVRTQVGRGSALLVRG